MLGLEIHQWNFLPIALGGNGEVAACRVYHRNGVPYGGELDDDKQRCCDTSRNRLRLSDICARGKYRARENKSEKLIRNDIFIATIVRSIDNALVVLFVERETLDRIRSDVIPLFPPNDEVL